MAALCADIGSQPGRHSSRRPSVFELFITGVESNKQPRRRPKPLDALLEGGSMVYPKNDRHLGGINFRRNADETARHAQWEAIYADIKCGVARNLDPRH